MINAGQRAVARSHFLLSISLPIPNISGIAPPERMREIIVVLEMRHDGDRITRNAIKEQSISKRGTEVSRNGGVVK
jgi:hypothetical protein